MIKAFPKKQNHSGHLSFMGALWERIWFTGRVWYCCSKGTSPCLNIVFQYALHAGHYFRITFLGQYLKYDIYLKFCFTLVKSGAFLLCAADRTHTRIYKYMYVQMVIPVVLKLHVLRCLLFVKSYTSWVCWMNRVCYLQFLCIWTSKDFDYVLNWMRLPFCIFRLSLTWVYKYLLKRIWDTIWKFMLFSLLWSLGCFWIWDILAICNSCVASPHVDMAGGSSSTRVAAI